MAHVAGQIEEMKLHLTPTLLTSGPQQPPTPAAPQLNMFLAIVESCLNVRALKPCHTFAGRPPFPSSNRPLQRKMYSGAELCFAWTAFPSQPLPSPTFTSAASSTFGALLPFFIFLFYNKLDLRKNRSPFISGGLMVSRRAANNKNTPTCPVGQGRVASGVGERERERK